MSTIDFVELITGAISDFLDEQPFDGSYLYAYKDYPHHLTLGIDNFSKIGYIQFYDDCLHIWVNNCGLKCEYADPNLNQNVLDCINNIWCGRILI